MLTYESHSRAPADRVWPLLAEPARWSDWAPHLHGAWGLGSREVRPGARGAVRLLGVVPVPAHITGKEPGRSRARASRWCSRSPRPARGSRSRWGWQSWAARR